MAIPSCSEITREFRGSAGTITLDEAGRHRRRVVMTSDNGIEFLLDLPDARLLRHGDGLMLSDGRVIIVHAAPEDLLEVRARDPRHLLTLAWQIGNRHLAAQLLEDRIRIRRDHVIALMLEGLGARIDEISAPFDPEGGAYGGAHAAHHHGDGDHGHHHHHEQHGTRQTDGRQPDRR